MQTKVAMNMQASGILTPELTKHITDGAMGLAGLALAGGSAALFESMAKSWQDKRLSAKVQDDIKKFANYLRTGDAFSTQADKDKAVARFYEIARVAPHITLNHNLVMGMIKSRLISGLTEDDRQRLAMLQAQYSKDPNVGRFMPKIASDKLGEIVAEAVLVKEAGTKNFSDSLKVFGALSMVPVLSGLVGGAVNSAIDKVKGKRMSEALGASYTQAMKLSPSTESLHDNPDKARRAFNTLASFAPQVALDPQAARAFMNKIVSYDQGVDMSTIKELSEITKNLSQTNGPHPFASGYVAGSNIIGGKAIMSEAGAGLSTSVADNMLGE